MQSFELQSFEAPEVIKGYDEYGTPITIFGCITVNRQATAALDRVKIVALHGLHGAHFLRSEDASFRAAEVSYSHLDDWLGRTALVTETGGGEMRLRPTQLPDISTTLANGTSVKIIIGIEHKRGRHSITWSDFNIVRFEFSEAVTLATLAEDYLEIFGNLLSFLIGSEVFVETITFPKTSPQTTAVEWLLPMPETEPGRELHESQYRVRFGEIADFSSLVASWFQYYSKLESILNLYFAVIASRSLFVSTRFLLLAQALEAYHNRIGKFTSTIQPRDEFQLRRDALVAAVPEPERKWLIEKLQHANQKTLAMRLDELIQDRASDVSQFISDTQLFANKVRWTRNYYTHYSEDEENRMNEGRGRILQPRELVTYASHMQALLELLFIADLGLPATATQKVVTEAQTLRVVSTPH